MIFITNNHLPPFARMMLLEVRELLLLLLKKLLQNKNLLVHTKTKTLSHKRMNLKKEL
jgi:hypothetical protein